IIILSCIGYTMKYLNYENSYLSYLNTAVYPFYILHQAIIVGFGYYILQWNVGIPIKLLALVLVCLIVVGLLYHFVIRKTMVTRVLFGMKWRDKPLGHASK
ncbi:MAG: glucan biosynthesis protein, partial [Bacteroidota bacterium]